MKSEKNPPRRRKARPLLIAGAGLGALLSGCNTSDHRPMGNLLAPQFDLATPADAARDLGPFGNLMALPQDMSVQSDGPFGNLIAPPQDMSPQTDGAPKDMGSGKQ